MNTILPSVVSITTLGNKVWEKEGKLRMDRIERIIIRFISLILACKVIKWLKLTGIENI